LIRVVTFDFDRNVYYRDPETTERKGDLDFLALKDWGRGDIVLTDDFSEKKVRTFLEENDIEAEIAISHKTVWSPARLAIDRFGGDFASLESAVRAAMKERPSPRSFPITPEEDRFPNLSSAFSETFFGLEKCGKLPAAEARPFDEDVLWSAFYHYEGFPIGKPALFDPTNGGKNKIDFSNASPLFMALSPFSSFYPVEDLSFSESALNSLLPKTKSGVVLLESAFFAKACSKGVVKSGRICGETACYHMGTFPTEITKYAVGAASFPMTALFLLSSVLNLFLLDEESVRGLAGFDLVRGSMFKEDFDNPGF